jgi:hypothetical protein
MKAILINVNERTITEVEVSKKNTLQDWYKLMGVELVTTACYLDNGDSILVDDEGLLKENKYFTYNGEVYAGNGLVVGTKDDGESCSCKTNIAVIENTVEFYDKPVMFYL